MNTNTDRHEGLSAAPRGTFDGAHLVTDYFGIERRGLALMANGAEKRIAGRHFRGARRSVAQNRRISKLRIRLRDLQTSFGLSVYGVNRLAI